MTNGTGSCENIIEEFEACERRLLALLNIQPEVSISSPTSPTSVASSSDTKAALCCVEQLEKCVSTIASLSPPVSSAVQLNVVKKVLLFCQQGELGGTVLFQALAHHFGLLFKAAYSLLKGCLDAAAKKKWCCHSDLETLLGQVTEVASLSLHFDPSLLVFCWRSIGRLVCGASASPSILPIIQQLSLAITVTASQSTKPGDPLLEKRLKSGRFLCSLLVRLLTHFPKAVTECAGITMDLLLSTHQAINAVQNDDTTPFSSLEANLLLLHEPLVEIMSKEQMFVQLLLEPSRVTPGQHCGWALCLATLFKRWHFLPESIRSYCLETVSSREEASSSCRMLDVTFLCVEKCHPELSFPFVTTAGMSNGQTQSLLSLYETLCSHMCVFISCLSSDQLHRVERNLLSHLCTVQPYSGLLASDLLFFIARLGGSDVAKAYCQLFMDLLLSLLTPFHSSGPVLLLSSLFNRTFSLLSASAQSELLSSTCISHRSWLWAHIKGSFLHVDNLTGVAPCLATDSISQLSQHSTLHTYEALGASLYCLCGMYEWSGSASSLGVDNAQVSSVCLQLLSLPVPHCHELCLRLIGFLLPLLPPCDIVKVSSHLSLVANSKLCLSLSLAVCHVLKQFSSLLVEDREVVSVLCECYLSLLHLDHWLLRHHTLDALRRFAEVTPDPSMVELCIPVHLTELVIAFLHKIPFEDDGKNLSECLLLSHLGQPLKTLQRGRGARAVAELQAAWDRVQVMEGLSTQVLNQLTTINASVSSFLLNHHF